MRKTKIVSTIGPVSESVEMMAKLVQAGVNVIRLNFSHGDHAEQGARIDNLRTVSEQLQVSPAILLDTKGPEIRTGELENPVDLVAGDKLIITTEQVKGNAERISVTYEGLINDVSVGSKILIDDGLIEVEVEKMEGNDLFTNVINGGTLKSKKGVNVPGVSVNLPGITEKDANDIRFGVSRGIDYIAASFVRKAQDVLEIRKILEEEKQPGVQIIAKIENQEGYDNLDEILEVADGIMVARGDLGVEVPAEDVPLMQKTMIRKCNQAGKAVITATQMLDSMERNPRPTRAEVTDVANAIFDGTDAVMLSGETAAGNYPVEAVKTMASIAVRTEQSNEYRKKLSSRNLKSQETITDAISQSVCNASLDLQASAILTPTESGYTARMISKYRPEAPVIALTTDARIQRRLALVWGVYPLMMNIADTTDEMLKKAVTTAVDAEMINSGDLVVITGGVPIKESGTTNMMKIHVVGDAKVRGQGIGKKAATGPVFNEKDGKGLADMPDGAIAIARTTNKSMTQDLERAVAIVTEEGGLTSHAAVLGLNYGIPVIVGAKQASGLFEDGTEITVDPVRGHIYAGHAKIL